MSIYEKLCLHYTEKPSGNINARRIATRLSAIAEIGQTKDGGSYRAGYSKEERQAKETIKQWMQLAGLYVYEDAAGNVFGRLNGTNPALSSVLCGSHADTVPHGGHFDGILGVISALEVAQSWHETSFIPLRSLEVAVFADEEGTRFHASLTGSSIMMGDLTNTSLQQYRDDQNLTFAQVLAADALSADNIHKAKRSPNEIFAFIELHIEQAKLLEQQNLPVGIVSGIAGPAWLELIWRGEAGHAGATPMPQRKDALAGAAEWLYTVEQLPVKFSKTSVATIGKFEVLPGGSNIIPGEVRLIADVRDIDLKSRDDLLDTMIKTAERIAAKRGLAVTIEEKMKIDPTLMSAQITAKIESSIKELGLLPYFLPSGAGHDAMVIGRHVPAGMIFVRCQNGTSHSPQEWVDLNDIVIGCQVLDNTLKQLVMQS